MLASWLVISFLFIGTHGFRGKIQCDTSDSDISVRKRVELVENGPGGGDYNLHIGDTYELAYNWTQRRNTHQTVVPYRFEGIAAYHDFLQKPFLDVMREMEEKTCIYFNETLEDANIPRILRIRVEPDCAETFVGYYWTPWGREPQFSLSVSGHVDINTPARPILQMNHYLCSNYPPGKDIYYSVVRHEFLHVFGIMHTQNREDRDEYVKIKWDEIIPTRNSFHQFEKCKTCTSFKEEIPYECHSIMHYSPNTFSRKGNDTIVALDEDKCDFSKQSNYLTDNDWLILHKAANCPGDKPNNPFSNN